MSWQYNFCGDWSWNFYSHSIPYTDSRRAVVSYWWKYMHLVLVNCLGGLNLPRKSVSRLTDSSPVCLGCPATLKPTSSSSLLDSSWGFLYIIWAPSSEFVSSSIPSWQILTAHAHPFRGARDLAFCLKVPLDSLLLWASSGGSGETLADYCQITMNL